MYERLFVEVCGMFNGFHFLTIGAFFLLLFLGLLLSRRMTEKQVERVLLWIATLVTLVEIVKIVVRIRKGLGPDSWMPLYYCSLFLYAIWLIQIPVKFFRRAGYAYLTMGGILGSVFFVFYPSTSLGMYPLISTASFHSFFFHLVMSYSGILVLWKGEYRPEKRDSIGYFLFIMIACCLAMVCNANLGTNCMFLRHPFGLPILQPILDASRSMYLLLVCLAQSSAMFWLNYGLYHLIERRRVV